MGCTTATNDEPPETAKATCKLLMSLLKSLSKLLTLASLNSFHSLEYMTQTLVRFMVPPATAPAAVPDGIFVRDKDADGMFPARIAVDSGDFIATAIEQARWNQKAAFALAAVFQAVGIMIPG